MKCFSGNQHDVTVDDVETPLHRRNHSLRVVAMSTAERAHQTEDAETEISDINENSNAKETLIDSKRDAEVCSSSSTDSKFSLETPWGILDATHIGPEILSEVPSKELFKVRLSRVKLSSLPVIDERLKKDAKDGDQMHDSGEATRSTEEVTTQTTKKLGLFGRLRCCFCCLVTTDRRQRRKQTQADDEFSTLPDNTIV